MKHLFLLFSVLLAFHLAEAGTSSYVQVSQINDPIAQISPNASMFGNESEVVLTELSKSEMWINAKKWISSSFKDYKHTVDMEDKESGTIIIKFTFQGTSRWKFINHIIDATLEIDVRDNKYRYTFSDVTYRLEPSDIINNGNFTYWSNYLLETAKSYLEAAEVLTEKGPAIDSSLQNDVKNYQNVLDNTVKYKNEKDAKKDKYTKEYMKADAFYQIANSIETDYTSMRNYLVNSLKESMIFKDDF